MKRLFLTSLIAIISVTGIAAQEFSLDAYKKFLEQAENMTGGEFYSEYPPGLYNLGAPLPADVKYLDDAKERMKLTADEIRLLEKHDFMVSERLSYESFWAAIEDIYCKDLPVFISTDMILHAFHMSYDAILKETEQAILYPKMEEALKAYHGYYFTLKDSYGDNDTLLRSINDYDVYFTVALNLLQGDENSVKANYLPNNSKNKSEVEKILRLIQDKQLVKTPLFSKSPKEVDFSQFTVRGHYTESEKLKQYFRTMMWLGRVQFYLTPPKPENLNPTSDDDILRQRIDAALIAEASGQTDAGRLISDVDDVIRALVGESDNVTINQFNEVTKKSAILLPSDFLIEEKNMQFEHVLENMPFAGQKILSQLLYSDPMSPGQIEPSSSFMLFGQRFVIDSYVTANVVYDKILHNKQKVMRMFPNSYDVLFALGNNAAGDFLVEEFERYPYYKNLSGLRYLIDSYNEGFWSSSLYNSWLNSLRTLNPPAEAINPKYPEFMQTAAWWQSKMNSQLAAWAQIRHDNLLYAKQSYTGGAGCSFPHVYLEPNPDFFQAFVDISENSLGVLGEFLNDKGEDGHFKERIKNYFVSLGETSERLKSIAENELNGTMNSEDIEFLRGIFDKDSVDNICVIEINPAGWYAKMFFHSPNDAEKRDYVVADVHTTPTDEAGNIIGAVWHVGTGPINVGIFIAENENGQRTAFAGPMMSYYEHWSMNFKRHTDEEWEEFNFGIENNRPDFTHLYLADKDGNNKHENPPILPVVVNSTKDLPVGVAEIRTKAFPNPADEKVYISLKASNSDIINADFTIYDIDGRPVITLYKGPAGNGSFTVEWDTRDASGKLVRAGVYVYQIKAGGEVYSGKIAIQR